MVKRCAWGTCNTDERYPDRLVGVRFYRFPSAKRELERCLRWIRACGRPYEQLNISRLNKYKVICSKHFYNGIGPTDEYPDPFIATCYSASTRKEPHKSQLKSGHHAAVNKTRKIVVDTPLEHTDCPLGSLGLHASELIHHAETQTEEPWSEPVEMLSLAAENERHKQTITALEREVMYLRVQLQHKEELIQELYERLREKEPFSVKEIKVEVEDPN